MSKLTFLILSVFVLLLCVNFISAQEIWNFHNFGNYYKVYKSATCDVQGKKLCPNELGWQGNEISFKFKLNQNTGDRLNFIFNIGYFISEKPVDIYVNDKIIAKDVMITRNSYKYSFEFSKSLLKNSKTNEITIKMKNVKVGYGKPSQGFVLYSISLEEKVPFCQSNPIYSSPIPISGQACCFNKQVVNSNTIISGYKLPDGSVDNRFLCYNGQIFVHDGVNKNTIQIKDSCTKVGNYYAFPNYPGQSWQGGWKLGNGDGVACAKGKVCKKGLCI